MKIAVISLNLSGGQAIANLFLSSNVSCKYFYDYEVKEVGYYEENINGLKKYIDEIYDSFDSFVEFPVSFGYEYLYEKDNNTKFIYIKRTVESWIEQMNSIKETISHDQPFYFEEFFCNHYIKTNKTKMSDLTDEELSQIYDKHNQSIETFFSNNENFLSIDFSDEFVFTKIKNFLDLWT